MSARISGQQIHFLSLQTAIFCVQCELISANTTPCCIACGSRAVLGLSRLLGGSLRTKPAARLIEDDELNQLVRDLLCTVPSQQTAIDLFLSPANVPTRDHARTFSSEAGGVSASTFSISKIDLEPAIGVITERAQSLTRATGAAIALKKGNEVICRARAGPLPISGSACKQTLVFPRNVCAKAKSYSATTLKRRSAGGLGNLPPPGSALHPGGTAPPVSKDPGNIRGTLRNPERLQLSGCRHHATPFQHDGCSHCPPLANGSLSGPPITSSPPTYMP